jgi:multimeric flavodoxin WrbA
MIYFDELIALSKLNASPKKKILIISGSPRLGGNSEIIAKQISNGIRSENIECKNINLGNIEIKGCIGCEKCRKDKVCTKIIDGMSVLYPDIIESQGLVLVSPVHNYNVTSWMKAFIDRLYCFYEFDNNTKPRTWSSRLANQNRKVLLSAICEQNSLNDLGFTLEAMQRPMEALGYKTMDTLPIVKAFEKGAVKILEQSMTEAYKLGIKFAKSLN